MISINGTIIWRSVLAVPLLKLAARLNSTTAGLCWCDFSSLNKHLLQQSYFQIVRFIVNLKFIQNYCHLKNSTKGEIHLTGADVERLDCFNNNKLLTCHNSTYNRSQPTVPLPTQSYSKTKCPLHIKHPLKIRNGGYASAADDLWDIIDLPHHMKMTWLLKFTARSLCLQMNSLISLCCCYFDTKKLGCHEINSSHWQYTR